eukprot:g4979.t1
MTDAALTLKYKAGEAYVKREYVLVQENEGGSTKVNRDEKVASEAGAVQAPKPATHAGTPKDGGEVGAKVEKGEGAQSGDQAGEERQKRGKKRKWKKKIKGDHKRRTRAEKGFNPQRADMMCRLAAQGKECTYGDRCKQEHSVAEFLKRKLPDLGKRCVLFEKYGHCNYGFNCRFGESHIDRLNLTLRSRPEKDGGVLLYDVTKNCLRREVQFSLRKRKYNFWPSRTIFASTGDGSARVKLDSSAAQQEEATTVPAADTDANGEDAASPLPSAVRAGSLLTSERRKVNFEGKIYIAPLTTLGNLPYRRIMKDYGADITCGEMAVATNLLQGQPSEWALLKRHPCEDIFGIQIAACNESVCERVGQLIHEETEVDFVDLNMGCPLDFICSRGMGSQLMMRKSKMEKCVSALSRCLKVPVTVKMRVGWTNQDPCAHKLVSCLQKLNAKLARIHGGAVGAVTVHGRSRTQRYTNLANWDYLSEASQNQSEDIPRIQFIGNGDVYRYVDWEAQMKRPGIDSCMLARGALIKPWLPTEIKEKRDWDISATERMDMLKKFVAYGLEHWGSDDLGVERTRRFFLEWQSFLHRYIPVGLLERPHAINQRPPRYFGRNELETLMASPDPNDWIKLSEMAGLGKAQDGFTFQPKHRANAYQKIASPQSA